MITLFSRLLLVSALSLVTFFTHAQGTIRGFVKDAKSGQPVLFIVVSLEGTQYGTQTDENGFYSLTKIPAGTYTLLIKQLGFKEVRESVTVSSDKLLTKNFLLEEDDLILNEITITEDGDNQRNNVNISVESMRTKDIKRIPSFGGSPDLVQALTTLPGIISTGDQGGQIYVRGGSPVQNKVLLDGMIVYNAFHSIGLFSVFDTDVISNADVYTGGFSAQYGGRISSVMDISTRDGNKRGMDGTIGVNPFGVKAQIEGPLRKLRPNGSGISYILSAKRSYLDQSSKILYPGINDGNGLPFNYSDVYGKISFGGGTGSKFNAFGFSFNDAVNSYQSLASLSWKNNGGGGNFVVTPSTSPVLISGNFARSKYEIVLQEENKEDRSSAITSFNFGLDFKYNIEKDLLRYGVEIVGFSTYFKTFAALDNARIIEYEQNTTELNGYFDYKFNRNRWVVEPSLRIQYYSTLAVFSPEPRLGLKYKLTDRLRLKAATGIYTQNLMATNSDRDVVNLFYGFLAGPENLQNTYTTPNLEEKEIKNVLQRAVHYIVGFELDITEKWNLNIEGYFRDFRQLTNTNRNKIFDDTAENQDRPEELRRDFVVETGWAAGSDFVLKYEDKRYYFNLVYSLAKVDRWDGFQWYPPVFDRRHNLNLIGTYNFGKDRLFEASVRWNLGSGLPFTQTQGFYQGQGANDGISMDYLTGNSQFLTVQYASLNGGRLPYYHRLDISIKRSFKFKNETALEVSAGATNLYNRANVFYIDRITGKRIDQLPFLPTIGVEYKF